MEEPIKPGAEQGQEAPDFSADLSHILSLLLTHDEITPEALNSEVERFIAIYEPQRTNEAWIMEKSKIFVASYLVSVLVDRFELLWPKNFLQLLLMCASILPTDVAVLFREGQASCEVLQTMDQALQNPEILSLGAKVLGLAAASHSKFRAEIATGDGVSLFVEAMKSHSKDVTTLTSLFIAMVNICYNNKDNKNTFIAHDGLEVFQPAFVLCNAVKDQLEEQKAATAQPAEGEPAESPRSDSSPRTPSDAVLCSEKQLNHFAAATLSLLRNIAALVPRETSVEPLIRSLMHFCRTFLSGKPDLIASALVCICTLMSTSVSVKTAFVSKWNGLEELGKLWTKYASYPRVMQPLTVILQLLSKINAHRGVIAHDFLARLYEQISTTNTREPGVLHPTMSVLYQLSFNAKTRTQVANLPDIMKTLLASLQVNMPSPRLHAVTSKVLIRLCAIDACKRQIQIEGGITAILTPMNAYSGDTRVTKFLAQLVNIVLATSTSSNGSSGQGASAANASKQAESDSYSDSDSDSYSSSDSDSDSDSSGSSDSSSDSDDNRGSTPPPAAQKPLPILSVTDLDAAIAELEASTSQFASSNSSKNTQTPTAATNNTNNTAKKTSPRRTGSGSTTKDLSAASGRPGTPVDSSVDDLNALARQHGESHKHDDHAGNSLAANSEIKAQLEKMKAQLSDSESTVAQLRRENAELKISASDADLVPKLKLELSAVKHQHEALKASEAHLETEAERARAGEKKALEELETLREGIVSENAVMESQLASLSASIMALKNQKEEAESEVDKKTAELRELNVQLSNQLESAKAELKHALASNSEKGEEYDRNQRVLEDERKSLREELSKLRLDAESSAKLRLENEAVLKREMQSAKDALEQRDRAHAAMEEEMASLRRERESLLASSAELRKKLSEVPTPPQPPLVVANVPLEVSPTPERPSETTSASPSAANQVFSQPAPSFSAQSVSSPSSATGGRTDLSTRPLSNSDSVGQGVDASAASSVVGLPSLNVSAATATATAHTQVKEEEDKILKEKGWIRLADHQTAVAALETQLSHLKFELDDALEHSLHFQVLSIRLDYLGRGDPVPSIEAIRELLLTGKSDQIPKVNSPRDRAAHHAAIVAHSYPTKPTTNTTEHAGGKATPVASSSSPSIASSSSPIAPTAPTANGHASPNGTSSHGPKHHKGKLRAHV